MPLLPIYFLQNLQGSQARCYVESEISGRATRIKCASATLTCDSSLRTVLRDIGASITCQTDVIAVANVTHYTSATIISDSTIDALPNKIVNASVTLNAHSHCTARIRVQSPPTSAPQPRVDWQNTMGAGMAVMGGKAPAVALTFIRGKHIYSEVKRRKKNLKVRLIGMAYEIEDQKKVAVKLVDIASRKAKLEVKMQSLTRQNPKVKRYGKIHIKQKQVRDIQVSL